MAEVSWPARLAVAGWSAALLWALWRFGATRAADLYVVFLALVPLALLVTWTAALSPAVGKRLLAMLPIGGFLLSQVAARPTLAGLGYLHLAVGWLTLTLVLCLAVSERRVAGWLLWVLVALGAGEAAYGAVQALGGFDYIGGYHRDVGRIATGSLINRNHFAGLLNMIWPFALAPVALRFAGSRRRGQSEAAARGWLLLLGSAGMGLAVLLSQSRAGALVMVATALYIAALLGLRRRTRKGGASGAVALLLILVVAGLGAVAGDDELVARFGHLDNEVSRLEVYADTTRMIADQPLVGVGPGMYRWRFRPYQRVWPGTWYQHAHNDYLETAAEWGVPLALLAWGFVAWRAARAARRFLTASERRDQVLALGSSAAIVSILLHSLVDLNLQVPANLMIFCSILALAWALDLEPQAEEARA